MEQLFKDLLIAYGLDAENCQVNPLEKGHIHDTYLVDQCGDSHPPLILQRINNYVFKDVPLLMHNMEIVTAHIAYKNRKAGFNPAKTGILLLEAEEGKSWIGNDEAGYWRMFWFIENQQSFEVAPSVEIAFEGGSAVAEFQAKLTDLDPQLIGDTIPRFHDLRMRMEQFSDSLRSVDEKRSTKAESLIEFARKYEEKSLALFTLSEEGNVPLRLTHNDTKFNNILFDKNNKQTCMIDLDTVMKGFSWFDFGDALRTCASIAPEDEPDTGKIGFRLDIFEGFAHGYMSKAVAFLSEDEIALLHRAPAFFAYMQGVRFLSDYLNNDLYYKTNYQEHNFERARAQFTLMERMLEQEEKMAEIVRQAKEKYVK